MGCSFSCKRLSSKSKSKSKSKIIRIIHMNGYTEEIVYPITAAELTGKPTSHFLFTQAQLLVPGSTPLKLDTPLEPGRVYFLLPFSLFDSNVSPLDLAPLARKLASVAQNSRLKVKPPKPSLLSGSSSSLIWSSPAPSPNSDAIGTKSVNGHFSWKPILSTIRERSFNRRESDLQEYAKVTE